MRTEWARWNGYSNLAPKSYSCGFCSHDVGSAVGYRNDMNAQHQVIYICTNCGIPTLFFEGSQNPGPKIGREVKNLPVDVSTIYDEMRNDVKNACYTSAVMLARKLIMHLAVSVAGSEERDYFGAYVQHLKDSGYIPPNGDKILTFIKDCGSEKNHQIKLSTLEEATKVLKFIEGLLLHMYEYPSEFDDKAKA